MIEAFHYLSPSNNISIDVYRHTLFVSINGPLLPDNMQKTSAAYLRACEILNEDFIYWGMIVSVNDDVILSGEVVSLLLSKILDLKTEKRKCCALVILPTIENSEKVQGITEMYLPDVPSACFDTLPQAMNWVDYFMNHFAAEHFSR